jgi:hypothetical protein
LTGQEHSPAHSFARCLQMTLAQCLGDIIDASTCILHHSIVSVIATHRLLYLKRASSTSPHVRRSAIPFLYLGLRSAFTLRLPSGRPLTFASIRKVSAIDSRMHIARDEAARFFPICYLTILHVKRLLERIAYLLSHSFALVLT